jgi:acetoin utilization deacetylase AcuC-like enzyme
MTLALVHHPAYLEHRQRDADHPERPERLEAVVARLKEEGLWGEPLSADPASDAAIGRAHDPAYIERLRGFPQGYWDADTYVREETFDLACRSAGGALLAGEIAWRERRPALALLRPPGHHATRSRAMGFCYFNNIAIAACAGLNAAAAEGRPRRVAIVDIDVHHGNGTQDIFHDNGEVLFVSLHQWPLYPGSGSPAEVGGGAGEGRTVNVALPPGCGDAVYADAFDRLVEPIVRAYAPSLLLVSLGADAHARDPLANMMLTTPGYLELMRRLRGLAGELCEGRLAVMLEGGYDLEALADVVAGTAAMLSDRPYRPRLVDPPGEVRREKEIVDRLVGHFARWWPGVIK